MVKYRVQGKVGDIIIPKKVYAKILALLIVTGIVTEAIFIPNDEVTKPPKRKEHLQWPLNHPSHDLAGRNLQSPTDDNRLSSREEVSVGQRDVVLIHAAGGSRSTSTKDCPGKVTGQFIYISDCRKFINCWKGRGFIQACAPGTLFNPQTLECDFPAKVTCLPYIDEQVSANLNEEVEEYISETPGPDYVEYGMIDVRIGKEEVSGPPGQRRASFPSKQLPESSSTRPLEPFPPVAKLKCSMPGGSGVTSHPTDCSKFLNCWKGSAHTQTCGPGTLFNPTLLQCDHSHNVVCSETNSMKELGPGKKWTPYPGFLLSSPATVNNRLKPYTSPRPLTYINTPEISSAGKINQTKTTKYQQNNSSTYNIYPSNRPVPNYLPSQSLTTNAYDHTLFGASSPSFNESRDTFIYTKNHSNPTHDVSNVTSHNSYSFQSVVSPSPPYNLFQPTHIANQVNTLKYSSISNTSKMPPFFLNPPSNNSTRYVPSIPRSSTDSVPGSKASSLLANGSHVLGSPASSPRRPFHLAGTTQSTSSQLERTSTELPLIHETTDKRTYYDPASGKSKTIVNKSPWLPGPNFVTSTLPAIDSVTFKKESGPLATPKLPFWVSTVTSPKVEVIPVLTTKMPSYIMSIPAPGKAPLKPTQRQSTNVGYSPSSMTSGQILRLRGGSSPTEGYVEIQGSSPGWGLVCDEANGWSIDEASVVCRQLGYVRGAELSWQGRPVRPLDDTIRVSVSAVKCSGNENSLSACRTSYGAGQCLIARDAVGVRCYRNHASVCLPEEVNHGGKCYSVIVPREDTAEEAFTHGEALADCHKRKAKLLDITSQAESDFISELLLQSYPHINSIITSGVGVKVMGHPLWIWEGSGESFSFQKWWPGWTGNETMPTANDGGKNMQCVVAKRVFPCQAPYLPDVLGIANLCEANYFYWSTENCSITHGHPYMCERPVDNVGCVVGSGQDYTGPANVSAIGQACLPWDSHLTPASLKYRMAYKVRQTTMIGHNYCRNTIGGETHPWCYVGPQAQFQYCDIPICQLSSTSEPVVITEPSTQRGCSSNQYECLPGECITTTQVCDQEEDCSNGMDEKYCPGTQSCGQGKFECRPRETVQTSQQCDGKADCSNSKDEHNCQGEKKLLPISPKTSSNEFECRQIECVLESRVCDGVQDCSNGQDERDCKGSDNVVGNNRSCSVKEFECEPGNCISSLWACDGVADCPDGLDERNCEGVQKAIASKLQCSSNEFECRPGECILATWVCDKAQDCSNGRDEKDCSGTLLQFSKESSKRLLKHDKEKWLETDASTCAQYCLDTKTFTCRSFSHFPKNRVCMLSDSNLGLTGQLSPSGDWNYYERRSTTLQCKDLFQCENGKCINKTMVCDGKNNCGDKTDERNCSDVGFEIRLAGSNVSHEGRVEVKVFGQWGAVCDDLFGLRDATVVCRELNFTHGAAEVIGQSSFGGASPVFLMDDLQCQGNETSIKDCEFDGWGVHDCGPEEAVGVVCRIPGLECMVNHWRCDTSNECIPVGFLCDNVADCEDGSDENKTHCEAPMELRLVGGPNNMSGRIEVRYHGIWGTICDDDFSDTAAQVICRELGFGGSAEAKKDAAFGLGTGQIWLDQLHCSGRETQVEDCLHSQWGENNCAHEEDASVVCSPGAVPKKRLEKNRSKVVASLVTSVGVTANQILPAQCGLKSDDYWEMAAKSGSRVLGGTEVAQGSFPWQASVRVRTSGKSVHWCGAVIISPLHVLTAGHCLQDYTKGAYLIRVGDHDTEASEGTEQEVNIDEIYVHHSFNKGPRLSNDIALVKLKSGGIRLGSAVQPVCLPPTGIRYHTGLNCSISGWGSVKAAGSGYSRKLRAAWVNVLPDDTCRASFVYGPSAINEGMVCAGDLEGKADSCQGDSGGPLICLNNGHFTLYGITSWGHGCGRANKPGVYSRVGFFRSWIDKKLVDSMTGK